MAAERTQEGRNLSLEMDELRTKLDTTLDTVSGQNDEVKRMLIEVLHKIGANANAGNAGATFAAHDHIEYPPGYEPHHTTNVYVDGHNAQHWNAGQANAGIEQSQRNANFAEDVVKNLEKMMLKEELQEAIHEQFKALQGPNPYGPMGIKELCLAPNVTVPKDFKMPEFIKFDGNSNPIMHLKMYCTKIGLWSREENFLISLFPESLDGVAWEWYMQMDRSQIKCWEDLATTFVNQYKFNLNTAPTRDQIKAMKKKNGESFKTYAQRWRALAAQVIPPMLEYEMCSYFIRTLEGPFYTNMLGTHVKEFVDLIEIGERIEADILEGKLESMSTDSSDSQGKKGQFNRKNEGDINLIQPSHSSRYHPHTFRPRHNSSYQYRSYHHVPYTQFMPYPTQPYQVNNIPYSRPYTTVMPRPCPTASPNYQSVNPFTFPIQAPARPNNPRIPGTKRPLPDFHISNAELFKQLRDENLVTPCYARPVLPPYPQWFNPSTTCEYHSNATGHSIDDCYGFRGAVWKLLDDQVIEIPKETKLSIVENSFPNHGLQANEYLGK